MGQRSQGSVLSGLWACAAGGKEPNLLRCSTLTSHIRVRPLRPRPPSLFRTSQSIHHTHYQANLDVTSTHTILWILTSGSF